MDTHSKHHNHHWPKRSVRTVLRTPSATPKIYARARPSLVAPSAESLTTPPSVGCFVKKIGFSRKKGAVGAMERDEFLKVTPKLWSSRPCVERSSCPHSSRSRLVVMDNLAADKGEGVKRDLFEEKDILRKAEAQTREALLKLWARDLCGHDLGGLWLFRALCVRHHGYNQSL
jgi:hypothetical protein